MTDILTSYFNILPILNAISVLLAVLFMVGAFYLMVKTGWLKARIERIDEVIFASDSLRKKAERSWESIERSFFSGNDDELKLAILKADVLLEEALKEAGIPGKDLGERLKKVKPSTLPNLDNVWEAHRLRNRIAHETNLVVKRDLAERALTVYEKALEYLGALPTLPPVPPTAS